MTTPTLHQPTTEEFRARAQAMAFVALQDAFDKVVEDETALKLKMEFVELAAKLGDLQPKQNAQVVPGAGFSVQIVLSGQQGPAPSAVIDVTPAQDPDAVTEDILATLPSFLTAKPATNADLNVPADLPAAEVG